MSDAGRGQHDESAEEPLPSGSHDGDGRAVRVLWSLVKAVRTAHWVWERLGELLSALGG